jgi:DNA-binding transcriptional MerR regulator
MKLLRIGELAKAAGITVRSLHHYDEIGLLRPTSVQESGHRWYNQKDVERLQQIISLKSLGLSLEDIAQCLDGEAYDLQKTLAMQDAAVSANIENLKKIQSRLRFITDKLARNQSLTAEELLAFMKEVQNMEKYYTPEQLEKLKDRYAQFPNQVKEVEQAWPVLFKKFEEAMKAKLPVTDLKVQVLASEAQHYLDLFTGGDKEIEKNLDKAYSDNQENALKTWGVSKEVFEYAYRARENIKKVKNS